MSRLGRATILVLLAASSSWRREAAADEPASRVLVLVEEGSGATHLSALRRELAITAPFEVVEALRPASCYPASVEGARSRWAADHPAMLLSGVICVDADDLWVYGVLSGAAYFRGTLPAVTLGPKRTADYLGAAELLREPVAEAAPPPAPSAAAKAPTEEVPPEIAPLVTKEAFARDVEAQRRAEREREKVTVGARGGLVYAKSTDLDSVGAAFAVRVRYGLRAEGELFAVLPFGAASRSIPGPDGAAYEPLARFVGARAHYHTQARGRLALPVGLETGLIVFSPNARAGARGGPFSERDAVLPFAGAHAAATYRIVDGVQVGADLAFGSALGRISLVERSGDLITTRRVAGPYAAIGLSVGVESQ